MSPNIRLITRTRIFSLQLVNLHSNQLRMVKIYYVHTIHPPRWTQWAQMDKLHKHQIIGMNNENTGMRGRDRLCVGHAAGQEWGRVKSALGQPGECFKRGAIGVFGHAEKGILQKPHNLCILIGLHCHLRAGFEFELKSSFEFTAVGFTHL